MALLAPTPAERLLDAAGRPYFLWDDDMTLDVFRQKLGDPDGEVRAYVRLVLEGRNVITAFPVIP